MVFQVAHPVLPVALGIEQWVGQVQLGLCLLTLQSSHPEPPSGGSAHLLGSFVLSRVPLVHRQELGCPAHVLFDVHQIISVAA